MSVPPPSAFTHQQQACMHQQAAPHQSSQPQQSQQHQHVASAPGNISYGTQVSSANQKHSNVDILLSRKDRTYRPNELVEGAILIGVKDGWYHSNNLALRVSGCVKIKPRGGPGTKGADSSPIDVAIGTGKVLSRTLIEKTVLVKPKGYLTPGAHVLPFTFPLLGIGGEPLLETYHGSSITVTYYLSITVKRGFFARLLEAKREFVIKSNPVLTTIAQTPSDATLAGDAGAEGGGARVDTGDCSDGSTLPIRITTNSITENSVASKEKHDNSVHASDRPAAFSPPMLNIRGKFDKSDWSLDEPITGDLTVALCAKPIKSIATELRRIERVVREGTGSVKPTSTNAAGQALADSLSTLEDNGVLYDGAKFTSYTTEVQTIQIADGDVHRGVPLPIYIVPPRLLICPTVIRTTFRIEFAIKVIIYFEDGTLVSEEYGITFHRGKQVAL